MIEFEVSFVCFSVCVFGGVKDTKYEISFGVWWSRLEIKKFNMEIFLVN